MEKETQHKKETITENIKFHTQEKWQISIVNVYLSTLL